MNGGRAQRKFMAVFLAPALVLFTVFVAIPSARALLYSLQWWDGLSDPHWVGLENFARVLTDADMFLRALVNNLILLGFGGTGIMVLALFFASLLHRRIRGAGLFRVTFFFPNVLSAVAIALLWVLIYSTTDFGVLNSILQQFRLGDSQAATQELRDAPGLSRQLAEAPPDTLEARLYAALDPTAREAVAEAAASGTADDRSRWTITGALNGFITDRNLLDDYDWASAAPGRRAERALGRHIRRLADEPIVWDAHELSDEARDLLAGEGGSGRAPGFAAIPPELRAELVPAALAQATNEEVFRLNRHVLEDTFSGAIESPRRIVETLFAWVGVDWLRTDMPFPFTESEVLIYFVVPLMIWMWTGFYMVLFLAAMENIPESYYEVAQLEGASGFAQFRHVTFPLIREVFVVGLVFLIINVLKFFDIIWVMENQRPTRDSHVLATLLYQKVFTEYNVGYGSAVAVLLFILVFLATLAALRLSRREALEY